jgi:ABC-type multidrug transport system ATPase subunit
VSILAVKNLKKIYSNNVLAINKISFDVSEGEIFAL